MSANQENIWQLELFSGWLGKTPLVYRETRQTTSEVQNILDADERVVFNSNKPISRENQYKKTFESGATVSVFLVEKRKDISGWKIKMKFRKESIEYSFLIYIDAKKNITAIQKYAGAGKKIFSGRTGSITSFRYFHKAGLFSEKEAESLQNSIREIPILVPLYEERSRK